MSESIDQQEKYHDPNLIKEKQEILHGDGDKNQQLLENNSFTQPEQNLVFDQPMGICQLLQGLKGHEFQPCYTTEEQIKISCKLSYQKLIGPKINLKKMFITNLQNKSYLRKLHKLTPFQIQVLDDLQFANEIHNVLELEQNMKGDDVTQISCKLSSHQQRGNILRNCKVMAKIFSEQMIKCLEGEMEEQNFLPEERIITINEIDDGCFYVITKGQIELIFEGTNNLNKRVKRNSLKHLSQGDSFGELQFLTGNPRKCSAISRGFTTVLKIKRENFLKVLSSFPQDYEKFCEVKHKLNQGDISSLQIQCYSCQSYSHLIDSCHYLHFCADKEAIIIRESFDQRNMRLQINIRGKKSFQNKWSDKKYIEIRLKDYFMQNYEEPKIQEPRENDVDKENQITINQNDFVRRLFQIQLKLQEEEKKDQILSHFDKGSLYTHFFPLSNYDRVAKRQPRQKIQYPGFSKYSFYFKIINKGIFGEEQQDLKIVLPQEFYLENQIQEIQDKEVLN